MAPALPSAIQPPPRCRLSSVELNLSTLSITESGRKVCLGGWAARFCAVVVVRGTLPRREGKDTGMVVVVVIVVLVGVVGGEERKQGW